MDAADECIAVEGFDHVLCLAYKQDNAGPHDMNEAILKATLLQN